MYFTPRIDEAVKLAARLHRNQTRKDVGLTPYISHLVSVGMILGQATEDEEIIIAGLMHDSLEDVPSYTYEDLVADCGARVATIVKYVTEPLDANKMDNEQLPWLIRKEEYLNNLRLGGIESAMVSAADKIHNAESFIADVAREQEVFLSRFSSSLRNKLWFHEQVLTIVQEKLGEGHTLTLRLASSNKSFETLVVAQEKNF